MNHLPIDDLLPAIQAHLRDDSRLPRNLVLRAPTGAGKTTRVPPAVQACVDGIVILTEPRRVAARAAAERMAAEWGCKVGEEIGLQVRFDSRMGPRTRIVVMTEGVLVRRLQQDPFAQGIGAIVFDEFHERHVEGDLALMLARQIQRELRPDLALVAMSATLDVGPLQGWLDNAALLESKGRSFPVETRMLERPDNRPLDLQVSEAVRRQLDETPQGDLLVFLPGTREIQEVADSLGPLRGTRVVVLHGRLPLSEQARAIAPGPEQKIILATNVAESSLTIPGVRVVIDSGLARVLRFDPRLGLNRLNVEPIARDAVQQRAGRAGREAPGTCVQLWSSATEARRPERLDPEILRVDLASLALELLVWGMNPREYEGLDPPPQAHWESALLLLRRLGLADDQRLLPRGKQAAELPLGPRLACVLLRAHELGVESQAIEFVTRFSRHEADAAQEASQLLRKLGQRPNTQAPINTQGSPDARWATLPAEDRLTLALLAGYPDRVAKRRSPGDSRALLVGGQGVSLKGLRDQDAHNMLLLCIEISPPREGSGESLVHHALGIEESWLDPANLREDIEVAWDPARQSVDARRLRRYLDLELDSRTAPLPPDSNPGALLAAALRGNEESVLATREPAFVALRARVDWLRSYRPDLPLPGIDAQGLADAFDELCMGKRSAVELGSLDLAAWAQGRFAHALWQNLDRAAPPHLVLPSGRTARIDYSGENSPRVDARIQELFGWAETPRLLNGEVPVVMHLLAPNGRPQQVTRDLRSFWEVHYPDVRKELRGRYPKHDWPEDPWSATPGRGPKRP